MIKIETMNDRMFTLRVGVEESVDFYSCGHFCQGACNTCDELGRCCECVKHKGHKHCSIHSVLP